MDEQLWNEVVEALKRKYPKAENVATFVKKRCNESQAMTWDHDTNLETLRRRMEHDDKIRKRVCIDLGVPTPEQRVQQAQISAAKA